MFIPRYTAAGVRGVTPETAGANTARGKRLKPDNVNTRCIRRDINLPVRGDRFFFLYLSPYIGAVKRFDLYTVYFQPTTKRTRSTFARGFEIFNLFSVT